MSLNDVTANREQQSHLWDELIHVATVERALEKQDDVVDHVFVSIDDRVLKPTAFNR